MTLPVRFVLPFVLFVAVVGLLAAGLQRDDAPLPSARVGKPAPDFELARLDDPARTVRPEALRGRVWLLNVWASWCAACHAEHPLLLEFARTNAVPLVGLNHRDERGAARAWLERFGNPYVFSLLDADGRVGVDFGVYGVPETYVIDGDGIVRWRHVGPLTPQVLQRELRPLLEALHG